METNTTPFQATSFGCEASLIFYRSLGIIIWQRKSFCRPKNLSIESLICCHPPTKRPRTDIWAVRCGHWLCMNYNRYLADGGWLSIRLCLNRIWFRSPPKRQISNYAVCNISHTQHNFEWQPYAAYAQYFPVACGFAITMRLFSGIVRIVLQGFLFVGSALYLNRNLYMRATHTHSVFQMLSSLHSAACLVPFIHSFTHTVSLYFTDSRRKSHPSGN